jgi:hypothetical protein
MLQCNPVIRFFRHKGLREFFCMGQSRRILRIQNARILILLDFLDFIFTSCMVLLSEELANIDPIAA